MNITRLLPLGMAFLAALQVSAQTSEGGTQPTNPADGKTPEIHQKRMEIQLGNSAHMDSLQAQLESLMGQYAADKPELKRDLEQLIQELRNKDMKMRYKVRELEAMRLNLEEGDESLEESLRLAEESVRNAQESLAKIDAKELGVSNLSVRIHQFPDGAGGNHRIMIMGDNAAGMAAVAPDARIEELIQEEGVAVMGIEGASAISSAAASGGTSVVISSARGSGAGRSIAITSVGSDPDASNGQGFTQKTMVLISADDSTVTETSVGNGSREQHRVIVRSTAGGGTNKANTNVYIRKFSNSEMPSTNFPLSEMDAESMPLLLRDNLIMIGSDSLPVQDGQDHQMMIRIYKDTASNGVHTNVVVVSMSRQLKADTLSGGQSSVTDLNEAAGSAGYLLEANRPNPFSETTTINFTLPQAGHVSLSVFDATGTLVKMLKDENMPAGSHAVAFDARELPSGLYLYRLTADGFSETKTMTVTK